MSFISYAQNQEDIVLLKALKHINKGFYIDIGACDPEEDSVTKLFYDRGWNGINLEPVSREYKRLAEKRPRDINLQCAAGSANGIIDLWVPDIVGWATSNQQVITKQISEKYNGSTYSVDVRRLSDICAEHAVGDIHFLKIDVEAEEKSVIEGMDFFTYRPWILVIEAFFPNTRIESHDSWEKMVLSAKYLLAYQDGVNRFYVAEEHSDLLSAFKYPPNVLDDFLLSRHQKSEARAVEAEAKMVQANARAAAAEANMLQANTRAEAAEANILQANTRAEAAEANMVQANVRTEAAEANMVQANTRAEAAEANMVQANTRAEAAEANMVQANTRAEAAEANIVQANARAQAAEANMVQANVRAEAAEVRAAEAEANMLQANIRYQKITNSRSWRITAPLRSAASSMRWFVRGSVAWLTLKPGSRPRRIARMFIKRLINWALLRPRVKVRVLSLLKHFPRIMTFLKRMHYQYSIQIERQSSSLSDLIVEPSISPKALKAAGNIVKDNERVVLFYVEFTSNINGISGVQRVCHKLAKALEHKGETVILVKLDPSTLNLAPLNSEERNRFLTLSGRRVEDHNDKFYDPAAFLKLMASLHYQTRQPWLIIPEVTYYTFHENPPTSRLIKAARDLGLRVGNIFYDAIPFLNWEASDKALKHTDYMSTMALADVIWPISHYCSHHLLDYFRRHEKMNDAELPVISVKTLPEEMDTAHQIEHDPSAGRNIVCVGLINERKNQITLVKAFNKYCQAHPRTDWKLHITGGITDDYRKVIEKEASKNTNIEFHYHVSDADIERFYKNCNFTVFPSLEEGYGLPIAESLSHTKPCICANFGAMAELTVNGGCLAVDTHSVDAILDAITGLIEDEELYRQKIDEIIQRPVKTWHEYAGEIANSMDLQQFGKRYDGFIYYWIDATLAVKANTGIQRVNRQLAKELISQGHKLVPIKWDETSDGIVVASSSDLQYMARWNGPAEDGWQKTFDPEKHGKGAAYLMVELPLDRPLDVQRKIIEFFRRRSVWCTAVFYDTIPHKLRDIYPEPFSAAHREYMEILDDMDLIMPISDTSADDLIHYLNLSQCRALALEERIRSVELPSEFPEVDRRFDNNVSVEGTFNILAVGTVEPRKNHETMIKAFFAAEKKSPRAIKLTIVGIEQSYDTELPGKITQLIGSSTSIEWIKNASDKTLREHYEKADLTLYASIEEGFGLPIVESLWFGIPCVCSNAGQMAELAAHGGCEVVDILSVEDMSNVITHLANNPERMIQLKQQIRIRHFKSWGDYASGVSGCIHAMCRLPDIQIQSPAHIAPYELPTRPVLSICISTYNRADRLSVNLENLMRVSSNVKDSIEIIVCDNCSTDDTPHIVNPFLSHENFRYYRNSANIGMLGNLPQTASLARGDYVWLIGDDDLLHKGALERVLDIIKTETPDIINVNYAYSPNPLPPTIESLDNYLSTATLIADGGPSGPNLLKEISAFNENFYTAVYAFITRRKHVQKIFNQDTSGAPFSSLQTCVPSSKYILGHLMERTGYWINEPLLTTNMNVSWGIFEPLWVMERIPEVYDLAELNGVPQNQVNRWRLHTSSMVLNSFKILFQSECDTNNASFDVIRFIRRFRHFKGFHEIFPQIEVIYMDALRRNHPLAKFSMDALSGLMR